MWKKRILSYIPGLLGALLFFLPFERIPSLDIGFGGTGITVRLSQLVGLLLWVIALIALDRSVFSVQAIKKLPIHIQLIILFLLSSLLSSLAASYSLKRALVVWIFCIFTVGVGLIVGKYFKTKDITTYSQYLAAGTWVAVVFGFYQFFGDIFGLSNAATGLRDLYTYSVLGFTRVQSTALEPLYLANFLLVPLFIYLAQYVYKVKQRPWLLFFGTTIFTLTVSRGAYIAALVGLIVFICLLLWKKPAGGARHYANSVSIIVAGVAFAYALSSLVVPPKRINSTTPPPSEAVVKQATNLDAQDDRVRNRQLALDAFKTRPILGVGLGNFDNYARQTFAVYRGLTGNVIVNNEPLELLAETGLVGVGLFLASMLTLIISVTRRLRLEKDPQIIALTVGLIAFVFALAVQYQTFSTLYIMHIWVAIGLLWGIAATPVSKSKRNK